MDIQLEVEEVNELAKECGFHIDFLNDKQALKIVETFATAIAKQAVENYKAELVPIGEIANDYRTGHIYNIVFYSNDVTIGTQLYALGEKK